MGFETKSLSNSLLIRGILTLSLWDLKRENTVKKEYVKTNFNFVPMGFETCGSVIDMDGSKFELCPYGI